MSVGLMHAMPRNLEHLLRNFLLKEFSKRRPAKKNKPMAKKQAVLDKMFVKIQLFKTNHKLNFYKKAKLWNAFKWKLLDANYDPEFVDELTKDADVKMLILSAPIKYVLLDQKSVFSV